MTTSAIEMNFPNAIDVFITDDTLSVELSDGRTLSVPLEWYPRLVHATPEERSHWRLIAHGHGIHWEYLDEDISVEGHGTHMLGRNCAPFTHFTVRYGETWRGYAWKMDPSLPHIDLPNRRVSVHEMAWKPVFGGTEMLLVASRHPEAQLLETSGYSKFMDETTIIKDETGGRRDGTFEV